MNDPQLIAQIVLWLLVLALTAAFFTSHGQQKNDKRLVMQKFGLPLMEAFPDFQAAPIQGGDWRESNEQKGNILLFTSATCESCQGIYPIVTEYAKRNDVSIALYMDGDPELIRKKIDENNVQVPVYHFTPDLFPISKVPAFPYAYYLSPSGIVFNKGGTQKEEDLDLLLNEGRYMENAMGKAG